MAADCGHLPDPHLLATFAVGSIVMRGAGCTVLAPALSLPLASEHELVFWCAPPAAEFIAVHAGGRAYSPARVWGLGMMLGIGMGRSFQRYLLDTSDPIPWLLWLTLGLPCLLAALKSSRQEL